MMSSFLSQHEIEKLLNRLNQDVPTAVKQEQEAQAGMPTVDVHAENQSASQEVDRVQFPELEPAVQDEGKHNLELFSSVPVKLSLELGSTVLTVREVLALQKNSIIKLERLAGENVALLVNGLPLATGEVVVINDNFGFRVTRLDEKKPESRQKE
jgi:flagellar motor switch protein FliN/FliY